MADGVNIGDPAGGSPTVAPNTKVLTDDCGAPGHAQVVKLGYSADGIATLTQVDANGVLVNLGANNAVTVSGTVSVSPAAPLPVTDNSGSLTVDAPVGTPAFVRLSDGAEPITTLPVSLAAAVPVTDNSGSLTVDYATTGSGTSAGALRVELPTNGTGVIATVGAVTAITNALPTGNNAIGTVGVTSVPADPFGANADAASASGSISAKLRAIATTGIPITGTVAVGTHDVGSITTAITPGTAAANLGKAEDAVAGDGDTGVGVLTTRADVPSTGLTSAVGDYQFATTDAKGRLWVNSDELGAMLRTHTELLAGIYAELRIHSLLLVRGLNISDDPDTFRADPNFATPFTPTNLN